MSDIAALILAQHIERLVEYMATQLATGLDYIFCAYNYLFTAIQCILATYVQWTKNNDTESVLEDLVILIVDYESRNWLFYGDCSVHSIV